MRIKDVEIGFPASVTHTIPARWLRPKEDERLVLSADSEMFHRARVCRDADGKTLAEIRDAAADAKERLHHVQGIALDDPDADWSVLTAETDHREWQRIAGHLEHSGLDRYDPRADPDAVEHPPLIRFHQR